MLAKEICLKRTLVQWYIYKKKPKHNPYSPIQLVVFFLVCRFSNCPLHLSSTKQMSVKTTERNIETINIQQKGITVKASQ